MALPYFYLSTFTASKCFFPLKHYIFPIDMLAEFKKQPIAGAWKLWRSHDSTSCFQQTSDALCSRLNGRHIQRPRVHVVHQWSGSIEAIVHGGGDHSSGACFHPAAAIQTWRDTFIQVKCGELDRRKKLLCLEPCSPDLQLAERGPFCWARRPCGCRKALRDRLRRSCSRCCWWSGHRPHPPLHQWALRTHPHLSPGHTQVTYSLMHRAFQWGRSADRQFGWINALDWGLPPTCWQPVECQLPSCSQGWAGFQLGSGRIWRPRSGRPSFSSLAPSRQGLPALSSPAALSDAFWASGHLTKQRDKRLHVKCKLQDHLRKPNASPDTESSMLCLSCTTPQANGWFSENLRLIQD